MIDYIETKGSTATSLSRGSSSLLGKTYWALEADLSVKIHMVNGSVTEINLPKGYLTDGATLPSLLYPFLAPRSDVDLATLVHDYLCDYGAVIMDGVPQAFKRPVTDALFRDILIYMNMPKWKAQVIYLFVRAFAIVTREVGPSKRTLKKRLDKVNAELTERGK